MTTLRPHVLPPTYADAPHRHNMTEPDGNGIAAWVSIDSAASFANRVEEKLVRANLGLDPLRVQVAGQTLSTLQMPHRVFDAILRDSLLDGVAFRKTQIGQAVIRASAADAAALLRYDPAVLLLGGWDSTEIGRKSNDGHKWPASVSVEIFGRNAILLRRAGNRIDPLGIEGDEQNLVEEENGAWRFSATKADDGLPAKTIKTKGVFPRRVKPSEILHSNALSFDPKGVLVEEIRLSGALSLTRLRRYHFGSDEQNLAARTALALMGIYGIQAVIQNGLDLRRDCELVADEVNWGIRRTSRNDPLCFTMGDARQALKQALRDIELSAPITFTAGENLEQLVARSR